MAIAVFPVYLSPIINSLYPLPTGIKQSINLIPVCIGSCTWNLGIIPGALISTLDLFSDFNGPLPSIGLPKASITLPNKPSPIGTSTMAPVLYTVSPSKISLSLPKTTTPTLSDSKFKAIPVMLFENLTISPA